MKSKYKIEIQMALSEYKMKQLCRCVGCHKSGMTEKKHGSSCCFTPNVTFKTKNINVHKSDHLIVLPNVKWKHSEL